MAVRRGITARWLVLLAVAGCSGLACVPPARAGVLAPITDWLTVLRDGSASDGARLEAATALLEQSDDSAIREALRGEIARPLAGAGGGAFVLQALADRPEAPTELFEIIADRLPKTPPEEQPKVLRALGAFRSREAARLALEYTRDGLPNAVQEAAFDALVHLSGRDRIPRETQAWRDWLTRMEALSELEWRDRVLRALARRSDEEAARVADLAGKLTDALRRLHLATPPDERGALLESMLRDTEPAVRKVGLELVARELSASSPIDAPVSEAILGLLADSDAQVRASAARLVRQLAPDKGPEAITRALLLEQDPRAAAAMLTAASRWPMPDQIETVLKWLASSGPAKDPACDAAWSLYKAAHLNDSDQQRLLSLVQDWSDESLTPSACGVLASLGSEADRERLRPLLFAPEGSVRNAVIEALLWYPEYLDDIVKAAREDPDLFDAASRALLLHEPTAQGLRTLISLPHPAADTALVGITRLARALSANDLLQVSKAVKDDALRVTLLKQLTSDQREMSERVDPSKLAALAEGMMTLADLQLASREPDQALITLESSPFFGPQAAPAPRGFRSLRCAALAALGRIDAADEAGGPPEAWVRGLEVAVKQPFAPALGEEIKRRFGAGLGDDLDKKVDSLLKQAAAAREGKPAGAAPVAGSK